MPIKSTELLLRNYQDSFHEKVRSNSVSEDVKKQRSYVAGENVEWLSHCEKWNGNSSKNLHTRLPCDPAISLLGIHPYTQRNWKQGLRWRLYIHVRDSITNDSQRALAEMSVRGWMHRQISVDTYKGCYSAIKRDEVLILATSYEPWKHDVFSMGIISQ